MIMIFEYSNIQKIENMKEIKIIQEFLNYDEYKKENLPLASNSFQEDNFIIKPSKLSKFFLLFFKMQSEENFEYWNSIKRTNFIAFITLYMDKKCLYCFKI